MPFTDNEDYLNDVNLDSVQELREFTNAIRPILLEESGYTAVKKTRTLEDALSGATQRQKDDLSWYDRSIQEVQGILDGGFVRGKLNTVTGQERGYGAGYFDQASLKAHLEKLRRDRESLVGQLTNVTAFEKTPEKIASEERYRRLEEQQAALTEAQLARVKAVMDDPNYKGSDTLQLQIRDEFQRWKEAQARAGNIVVGDDPFTAVGKSGTASIESLKAFQDNVKTAIDREKNAIIQGETPLAFAGFGLTSGGYGNKANETPRGVDYSGLFGATGATYQPFQFSQQMGLQRDMFNYQQQADSRNRRTQMLSGLINTGLSAAMLKM